MVYFVQGIQMEEERRKKFTNLGKGQIREVERVQPQEDRKYFTKKGAAVFVTHMTGIPYSALTVQKWMKEGTKVEGQQVFLRYRKFAGRVLISQDDLMAFIDFDPNRGG